uniref:N-alpha-acetyltransferase 50 n=1 Tax=Marmota marmota marmota TaxID=9994 RepID=A0A8C5Z2T1_MARMA
VKGSQMELGDARPHNIKQLKRLNQVIFLVSSNDRICLAHYRKLGIGTKMLNNALKICMHHCTRHDGTFDNICLHVWISNEPVIDFYRKFGFETIEMKKNYCKRIETADHILIISPGLFKQSYECDYQKLNNWVGVVVQW